MLPGLSGIELCRRLRARPETKQLPIIMLTARGEESERVRGLATGADDYIVKPFSVPELMRAGARAAAPRAARSGSPTCSSFGDSKLDREKKRVSRSGRADRSRARPNIRLLEFLMERPGPRVLARAAARRRVGQRRLYRRAHRRRPCRPAAQGAQPRPRRPIRSAPCAAPATRSTTASGRVDAMLRRRLKLHDSRRSSMLSVRVQSMRLARIARRMLSAVQAG